MYEPILISKKTFDSLNDAQKQALVAAGKKAETYAYEEAKKADQKLVDAYKKAGVEVVYMSADQFQAWRKVAAESSYKSFAGRVPGGQELLDLALSVQ